MHKINLFIIVDPYMKGEFIAPPPGKILNLRRFSLTHPGGWKIKWRQRALYQKLNKERFPDFCVQAKGGIQVEKSGISWFCPSVPDRELDLDQTVMFGIHARCR